MAVLDDLGHLAIEEGQEQRADMRAVDVGVGHDDDLVIAQLVDREFVADAGAERLDQRSHLLRRDDAVEVRALDVQYLALQRQDRLDVAVAALFGAAACGISTERGRSGKVLSGYCRSRGFVNNETKNKKNTK